MLKFTGILGTVLVLMSLTSFGQQASKVPPTEVSKEEQCKVLDDLKEVDLGFLKLSIPSRLVDQKAKGIEGGYWKFIGDGMVLSVDRNVDAWRPTFERDYPSYKEDVILIDGVRSRLWSFSDEAKSHFVYGANYATEKNHRVGLGIYLQSDSKNLEELATKVFLSVRFVSK